VKHFTRGPEQYPSAITSDGWVAALPPFTLLKLLPGDLRKSLITFAALIHSAERNSMQPFQTVVTRSSPPPVCLKTRSKPSASSVVAVLIQKN
jgi:hypothetical protein